MLDGERGQVGIADHVAPELVPGDQVGQDPRVARTLARDPGDLGLEPVGDEADCLLRGQRVRRGSFMGADPNERDERLPREGNPAGAVELKLEHHDAPPATWP